MTWWRFYGLSHQKTGELRAHLQGRWVADGPTDTYLFTSRKEGKAIQRMSTSYGFKYIEAVGIEKTWSAPCGKFEATSQEQVWAHSQSCNSCKRINQNAHDVANAQAGMTIPGAHVDGHAYAVNTGSAKSPGYASKHTMPSQKDIEAQHGPVVTRSAVEAAELAAARYKDYDPSYDVPGPDDIWVKAGPPESTVEAPLASEPTTEAIELDASTVRAAILAALHTLDGLLLRVTAPWGLEFAMVVDEWTRKIQAQHDLDEEIEALQRALAQKLAEREAVNI